MATTTAPESSRPKVSPRKRAQRVRIIQYVVLALLLVGVLLSANLEQIKSVFFEPELIKDTFTSGIWHALRNTLIYTFGAFVFGLLAGTVLALMRLSQNRVYRWLATSYIEFFRGLPAIVILIAFGLLPAAFEGIEIPLDPYGTVWIALGIVAAAYMAETIRAGIQAVPKGQVEAARSLGMSQAKTTRKIVLPQAFRIILPPLTNELILLVKDSSLVYVLGFSQDGYELTKFGRELAQDNYNLTPLVACGFAYLIITLPLSYVVRRMEAKAAKAR